MCNGLGTFERLSEHVLAYDPQSSASFYRNDQLIHAADFAEAMQNLKIAFTVIHLAGLGLNPRNAHSSSERQTSWAISSAGRRYPMTQKNYSCAGLARCTGCAEAAQLPGISVILLTLHKGLHQHCKVTA